MQRAVLIDEVQITADAGRARPARDQRPGSACPAGTGTAARRRAAAGGPAQHDPEHLREQVLRWVRAELLVNRERAGRLTDLR